MRRLSTIALAFLLINSAYLAAFPTPTVFYMANVVLHLGVGLALMILALPLARRYPRESGAFLAAGVPALFIAVRGNTIPHQWILWLHIVLAVLAVALIVWRSGR